MAGSFGKVLPSEKLQPARSVLQIPQQADVPPSRQTRRPSIWVIVKIMVPVLFLNIIRHLVVRGPKKGPYFRQPRICIGTVPVPRSCASHLTSRDQSIVRISDRLPGAAVPENSKAPIQRLAEAAKRPQLELLSRAPKFHNTPSMKAEEGPHEKALVFQDIASTHHACRKRPANPYKLRRLRLRVSHLASQRARPRHTLAVL